MPLESGTYISDFVVTNPVGTDQVSQADDHLRWIKSAIQVTFPNITGAVTGTQTAINTAVASFNGAGALIAANGTVSLPGISWASEPASGWYRIGSADFGYSIGGTKVLEVTASGFAITGTLSVSTTSTFTGVATFTAVPVFSAGIASATATTQSANDNSTKVATTAYVDGSAATLTTSINLKAPIASPTFTGTPAAPTPTAGDSSTKLATTAFVNGQMGLLGNSYLQVQDQKTSGTQGGGFTAGAWRTRTLNTAVTNNISGASLASNQITLPAGTYYCIASAPAGFCNNHQARLQNVTDASTLLTGTVEMVQNNNSGYSNNRSHVSGMFTLSGTKAIELQHQCTATRSTDGLGSAGSITTEVYSDVQIWRVA